MKRNLLAAALLFGGVQAASADVGDGLVGNTVVLTGPDGAVTRIYYPDASTFELRLPDGNMLDGSWRVEDGKICTTVNVPGAAENCSEPLSDAPRAGAGGRVEGETGSVEWSIEEGRSF